MIYREPKSSRCDIRYPAAGKVGRMARPYGEPVEIITAPVPARSPFIPLDAKIVVGAVAPASPDPIPIVLLPGFEYRMLEWRHPETHEIHWRLERAQGRPVRRRRRVSRWVGRVGLEPTTDGL